MTDQLKVGMMFEKMLTVTEALTPPHLAGHGIGVLATPEMVRLIEQCALEGVQPLLQPNQSTVGMRVDVRHLGATPVGMMVTARCVLAEIDRRRLVFRAEVRDEMDKVGEGTHERFIVDADKHQDRIKDKVARWKGGG